MEEISRQLGEAGYDYAVAIATEAEINAKAACGQLSIIIENESNSQNYAQFATFVANNLRT